MSRDLTDKNLENMALFYLERYSASTQHFKQVMLRKTRRKCDKRDLPFKQDYITMIDNLTDKMVRLGYLDDTAYISAIIKSGFKGGKSAQKIRAKLLSKRIATDAIDHALSAYLDENSSAELHAGISYIRKKKLGCYGPSDTDRQKSLARLGYAGFSFEMAQKLLGLSSEDAEAIYYREI